MTIATRLTSFARTRRTRRTEAPRGRARRSDTGRSREPPVQLSALTPRARSQVRR